MSEIALSRSYSNKQIGDSVNDVKSNTSTAETTSINNTNNSISPGTTSKLSTEITTISSFQLNGDTSNRFDIDIDYAIELLKREDQHINV